MYTQGNWFKMDMEFSSVAEEGGRHHLQPDGGRPGKGPGPPTHPGTLTDNFLSPACVCTGKTHLFPPPAQQQGAAHSSESEANAHLEPSTQVSEFCIFIS